MDEFQQSPVSLVNNDDQHVFVLDNSKNRPGLRIFLLLLLAGFIGMLAGGVVSEATGKTNIALIVFGSCLVVLTLVFNLLAKKSREKAFTHLIVSQSGLTFLRRNNQTVFYHMSQFINMKVTRHYYNGAYTGSSHSLLFKNEKGKQIEIGLGGIDKDLVSGMYDDIMCMKTNGRFYAPEITPAVRTVPVDTNIENPIVGTDVTGETAVKTEVDPQFPYGVSPIDGKFYTHDADAVVDYKNKKVRSYKLLTITMVLLATASLLGAFCLGTPSDPFVPLIVIAAVAYFSLIFVGIFGLAFSSQNKQTATNIVKKIEFFSNCIVVTTTYEKHVCEIPNIMRVLLPKPDSTSPQFLRKLKIQTKDSQKIEINMGRFTSKKGFEIFNNYKQFYMDINLWCSNHGIVCVNDISS